MFKVGDKVKIYRKVYALGQEVQAKKEGVHFDPLWKSYFLPEMEEYIGKSFTISQLHPESNSVRFYGIHYNFSLASIMYDFDALNLGAIYDIATNLKIPGRSYMNRAALVVAITNYLAVPAKPVEVIKPVKTLGQKLKDEIKKEGGGIATYALVDNDNKEWFYPNDICHARLCALGGLKEVVLNVSRYHDNHPHKDEYKQFVIAMLTVSPFAKCFVTKDWKAAYNDGVYLNVNMSHSQITAAAIALRGGSEYYPDVVNYSQFIKDGYTPAIAWTFSQLFSKRANGKWIYCPGTGAHRTFAAAQSSNDRFIQFLKEGFWNKNNNEQPASKYAGHYSIFDALVGKPDTVKSVSKKIREMFKLEDQGVFGEVKSITTRQLYTGMTDYETLLG